MMKALFGQTVNKAIRNIDVLQRLQRFSFSLTQLELDQKSTEISQHRSAHQFASILNATSVQEIQSALREYQSNLYGAPKRKSTDLLQLLDDIASHKFDDELETESEKHPENESQEQQKQQQQQEEEEEAKKAKWMNRLSVTRAYCIAIEKCAALKEFDEGLKLFEDAKQRRLLSPNTFAALMMLIMQQTPSKESVKKCFELRQEMEANYNMKPTGKVFAQLLSNAMAYHQSRKAGRLVKEMMSMEESDKVRLFRDRSLRFFMLKFYADRKQINEAIQFMSFVVDKFGDSAVDDYGFAAVLKGIALCVEEGDESMVEVGEAMFKKSFDILGRAPNAVVFNSCMNMYAYVPDYESCLDMMQSMLDTAEFAKPSAATFGVCLKSLALFGNQQPFEYEQAWKLVHRVLDAMKQRNVTPNLHIYATLFNLCSGSFCGRPDIDRLYRFYEEMTAHNIRMTEQAALNLILAGLSYFEHEMQSTAKNVEFMKQEAEKFVDWALQQCQQHNVALPEYHRTLIRNKLQEMGASDMMKEHDI